MQRRVGMHRLQELVRLHRLEAGDREIARVLGMSPNTERQYRKALIAAGLLVGDPSSLPELEVLKSAVLAAMPSKVAPQQQSSLESWLETISGLQQKGLGPRAIYDRLRLDDEGFRTSAATLSSVKRVCLRLKKARGVQPEDVAIPVETRPGEVAQVDFGYVGKLYDASARVMRKTWVFVLVLGHSRHMAARLVFDQKVETWLRLHVEAFEELGGVPEVVVPDNLKSAVVRAAFGVGGETALNRSYRELARHYGFKVDPAPIYQPKKKGKVESAVKYVKGNFFRGQDELDVEVLSPRLARWVREVAGTRQHGTTGKRPLEVFETEERAAMKTLPTKRFATVVWKESTVHQDSHVEFCRRLYSVPWRLVGSRVWLQVTENDVVVFADDQRVATHPRRGPTQRSTYDEHLPEHRGLLRHRSRAWWEERAARIGPETAQYVKEIFDSDDVLSQLRPVQAIVTHLERHPVARAEGASRRARHFGSYGYRALKNILVRGLDLEPLPAAVASPGSPQESFRFARSAAELLNKWKPTNEPN
jgi:transposase